MKEIRKERTVVVEEVTFIADDGREFKVDGNITEEQARKNCELHNREIESEKLKRDYDKLQLVTIYNPDNDEIFQICGQINNEEEWETLCLYLRNEYCYSDDFMTNSQPEKYPFRFVADGNCDSVYLWKNAETFTDENGKKVCKKDENGNLIWHQYQPEQLLEALKENVAMLENHIATMNKSK